MRTITTTVTVYKFDELSDEAKEKALDQMWDINVDYEWWDTAYDDAKSVGIKIEGFDIDRGSYCKATFIEDAVYTATKIKENHGETCETYKTAEAFLSEIKQLREKSDKAYRDEYGENFENAGSLADNEVPSMDEYFEDNYEGEQSDIEDEFLKSISEDYRIILTRDYEYLTSKEAVISTIQANEYEFTEDGKHY